MSVLSHTSSIGPGTSPQPFSILSAAESLISSPSTSIESLETIIDEPVSERENFLIEHIVSSPMSFGFFCKSDQTNFNIVRDYVALYPEKFYEIDAELQEDQRIQTTALVAAIFLKKIDLALKLQTSFGLTELAHEIEASFEQALHSSEDGLWNIYAYALYAQNSSNPAIFHKHIPDEFKSSYNFAFQKVQQNGLLLQFFPQFQKDVSLAKVAVRQNFEVLRMINCFFENAVAFYINFSDDIRNNPAFLQEIPSKIRHHPEFVRSLHETTQRELELSNSPQTNKWRIAQIAHHRALSNTIADSDF